jgi:hypothetical protein
MSMASRESAASISALATGAYLAAMRKQPTALPVSRYLQVWVFESKSVPVRSKQSTAPFCARNDLTIRFAASIATASARAPAPKRRCASAPAASAEPQTMPHWYPFRAMPPASGAAARSSAGRSRPKARSTTAQSASDQVPTFRKVLVVPHDEISPLSSAMASSPSVVPPLRRRF